MHPPIQRLPLLILAFSWLGLPPAFGQRAEIEHGILQVTTRGPGNSLEETNLTISAGASPGLTSDEAQNNRADYFPLFNARNPGRHGVLISCPVDDTATTSSVTVLGSGEYLVSTDRAGTAGASERNADTAIACWSPMRKPVSSNSASNLSRLNSFGWRTDSSKFSLLCASVPLCEIASGTALSQQSLAIHFRSRTKRN
jgi:hypothetical protein